MTQFDVAVIGAGPAGAWTAFRLAELGARVVIVDPSHPREKPCGGGVTGRALALVGDALGEALPSVAIRNARFVEAARAGSTTIPLASTANPALVVASRSRFDGLLLSAALRAGAQLLAARVTAVTRDGAGWCVDTTGGARLGVSTIVGADGANSLVRRRVTRAFRRDQLSIATGFFAHGVTGCDIVIEFIGSPPGYIWSFPRPDHLAIGICAQADAAVPAGALRARTAQWLETTRLAVGARLEPYAWPIPSLSAHDLETEALAGPGWMLVGDAAGLVDPITREGIFFALQSASAAAEALSSHSSNAASAARAYRARVASEITSELARAARFKARFFRPGFIDLMLDALERSERVRRVMADLIAGTQTYRGLKRRLAATWEFGLAWNVLSERSTRRGRGRRGLAG